MKDLNKESVSDEAVQTVWNKAFINVFVMNVFLMLGLFMTNALVPTYAEHVGATAAIVGVVTSMFAVTALAVRPIVGPSTSYFRNNRLLAAAIVVTIAAFVCYGFSESVSMIIVGRLLHGIGMGFFAPVSMALVSDTLPSRKLASGIGIFSLGQAIATAIGPAVGLELVQQFGYRGTFFIGALIMGFVLVLSLRLKSDPPEKKNGFKIRLVDIVARELTIPATMMFFLASAYSCINAFILIYGGAAGVKEIGLFFTAYAVCLFISRPISGRLSDKYGVDKILIPGMIMFALSFLLLSYSRAIPMFLISGAVSAFGYGICQPALQTLCIQMVSKERRGVAGNTIFIGVDTGYLIAPSVAGLIVTYIQSQGGSEIAGYAVMFQFMTIPILIALMLFLWKRKNILSKIKDRN
ncbi:MFS transporter [Paenibacillus sp. YIM B09110]|uniref:MFS transporter n=1 Tax=Paenibacillus sp. YIM B09110 TaxID=3126102 RepID=UPI00301DA769